MTFPKKGRQALVAGLAAGVLALSACSSGSLGSSDPTTSAAAGNVEITYLVDSAENTVRAAEALATAFNATNVGVTVDVETRAQGTDGDNAVKTKLATAEMNDVFAYNSGSLMQALDPATNLVPPHQ